MPLIWPRAAQLRNSSDTTMSALQARIQTSQSMGRARSDLCVHRQETPFKLEVAVWQGVAKSRAGVEHARYRYPTTIWHSSGFSPAVNIWAT